MREFFKYHKLMWFFFFILWSLEDEMAEIAQNVFFMKTDEDNSQLSQCGSWKGEDFQI